jgi:type VI secretion system ImpC/EvpB family protein
MLRKISEVAALSFCPFIAGASPSLFESRRFSELGVVRDLARQFRGEDYIEWRSFRDTNESAFIGLTLPHVLLRPPYDGRRVREDGFDFREEVEGPDSSKLVWGNSAFAFAQVLIRAFAQTGWLAHIRGVARDQEEGGLVSGLPVTSFETDRNGLVPKSPTDFTIAGDQEKEFAELGLLPLCCCHGTGHCAFYTCPSTRLPPRYSTASASANARVAAMLQNVLCASRFAHYLNNLARDLIGSGLGPSEIQSKLNNWLYADYVVDDPNADVEQKAKRPLRKANCQVVRGSAGSYECIIQLQPHAQLDGVSAEVELKRLQIG